MENQINKSILQNITEVYNQDLSLGLKHSIVCRLISKLLDVNLVSIFIFDGILDRLDCVGSYTNIKNDFPLFNRFDFETEFIVRNIPIFEFCEFHIQLNQKNNITWKNYQNDEKFFDEASNKVQFDKISQIYLVKGNTKYEMRKKYLSYKQKIHNEHYEVEKDYISSKYFRNVLDGKNGIYFFDLSKLPFSKQKCFNFYRDTYDYEISTAKNYTGFPISAGKRSFGIIRILSESNLKELIFKNGFLIESLCQIVSLHIKNLYQIEGYKNIVKADLINTHIKDLNKECDILSKVINCLGVIIRLKSNDNIPPEIAGFSKQISRYVKNKLINNDNFAVGLDFHHSFIKLFFDENSTEVSALKIELNFFKNNPLSYTYYQYDGKHFEQLDEKLFNFSFDQVFPILYLEDIAKNNKISEIVILRIPFIERGLASFISSEYRSFDRSDIELMIMILKKLGFELKHFYDEEKKIQQKEKLSTIETTELIIHQLSAPINQVEQLSSLILFNIDKHFSKNINENSVLINNLKEQTTYLRNKTRFVKRHLISTEQFLNWESGGIQINKVTSYRLKEHIVKLTHIFRDMINSKGINIFVFEDNSDFNNIWDIDPKIIDELFICLIDNALKYSYYEDQLRANNINFEPNNFTSDGHIHIGIYSNLENLVINIINWGLPIRESEYSSIFNFKSRGTMAKVGPNGNGIGLYIVKKIVDALNGKIMVNHKNHKTIFTLEFKRE